ncbi:polyglutamine-binding protein 1 [Parasteatoda tepidariorum]|uniref:polyglutamine-binding protein 1 n=1 Tax=Parasteatoda tepidariorum TaxID=114398 RepID=UPI0039BD487A
MPLPAALLSRLKKRGIVKQVEPEIEEEVIAEDYDDNENRMDTQNGDVDLTTELKEPWDGCPNKWNIYHDCTVFCKETWGFGKKQPSPKSERKRLAMLKKYPLPNGWEETYDPGAGRYYYWNTATGEVAWLSPSHPRCKISPPAEKLRAVLKENFLEPMDEGEDQDQSDSEDSEDEDNELNEERNRMERQRKRDLGRERARGDYTKNLSPLTLIPFKFLLYRGTWSSGLDRKGEAKTGADTTASGPLYQMRPYPSPGAVLRLNAEIKNKDASDDEED